METISNHDIFDTKCPHHSQQDVSFICIDCNNEPACSKCVSSIHKKHELTHVDDIEDSLKIKMVSEFNNDTISQLYKQLDNSKSMLNQSNYQFKLIEEQHLNNFDSISKEFDQLHSIISITENNLKSQLISKFDENKQLNTLYNSTLDNIIKTLDLSINHINKYIGGDSGSSSSNSSQLIQSLKHNYQCKSFILSNNNSDKPPVYKETAISINKELTDSIKDNIKSVVELIKTKTMTHWGGNSYIIYEDGDEIPEGTKHLAIGHGHSLPPLIPPSVDFLLLPDGFNCSIESLQQLSVSVLHIFDIEFKLVPGSLPKSITHLSFGDGFPQKLVKGIIPDSIQTLYLGDIEHPLDKHSIPESVKNVCTSSSFKHSLPSKIINHLVRNDLQFKYKMY